MAATGNEVVLLHQLKSLYDRIGHAVLAKVSKPSAGDGTSGQMLVSNGDGTTSWADVPDGTAYSADNATLQLTGTQFSVKDGGITAAKIADGTITEDKIAENVLPTFNTGITGGDVTPHSNYVYLSIPISINENRTIHHGASLTIQAATSTNSGIMSAADKKKLDGLSNYTLPEASTTTLGGVKVATDGDAKAFLGY